MSTKTFRVGNLTIFACALSIIIVWYIFSGGNENKSLNSTTTNVSQPIPACTNLTKWGLQESDRIKIWILSARGEEMADNKANWKFNLSENSSQNQIDLHENFREMLTNKSNSEIKRKYKLSNAIFDSINFEGVVKRWDLIISERKKRLEEKLFNSVDGSQPNVERYIKSNIKDPDSYRHIFTSYIDDDSTVKVYTKFTATNSFGARISTFCEATIDTSGNLLDAKFLSE